MIKFKNLHEVNDRNRHDYLHGLYIETWEDLLVMFSLKEMNGVYATHYDPVVITVHIHGFRVERLMVDEGSGPTVLFSNFWERVSLAPELVLEKVNEVAGFDELKSRPRERERATLAMSIMGNTKLEISF